MTHYSILGFVNSGCVFTPTIDNSNATPGYRHPSADKNRPNFCPHKPDRFVLLLVRTYNPATQPQETPLAPDCKDDPN
jgi:hypothetical protein